MNKQLLTETSPYWKPYIAFHTQNYGKNSRDALRIWLYPIHYGQYDTSKADEVVARIRAEKH